MTIRPEPKRDRYSRYLIVPPGGGKPEPYTRVTTISSTLDDRWGLERWKNRKLAKGLGLRADLLARVVAAHDDDRDVLDRLCDEAVEAAAGSAGANTGSALHALAERIDLGEEDVPMPDHLAADVNAYRAILDANGIGVDPAWVEQVLVLDDLKIAGTADRFVTLGSRLFVADLKTGQSLDHSWLAIAQQEALYAHADHGYDVATDTRIPMPANLDRDTGLVIHVPAGQARCELHWVDLTAGWQAVQTSLAVREWRKRKDLAETFTLPAERPPAELRAWLVDRIAFLRTNHPDVLAAVAAAWPVGVPTLKQSDAHDAGQLQRIVDVVLKVEAAHQIEFPDSQPPQAA